MQDRERILRRAERALASTPPTPDPSRIRSCRRPCATSTPLGGRRDRSAILRWWPTQAPGGTRSDRRFRWDVVWDGYPARRRTWARNEAQERTLWRPRENSELEHDPTAFSERLLLPIVLTETLEFLEEIAADEPALAGEAARLRDEALPLMEDDFAEFVGATDPWRDTFALWQLTRHARALERLDPLAIATATRYATRARREGGIVRGVRFPFFEAPLRSASAHLAGALWTLGIYPTLLPDLVGFAGDEQHPDGGWGDPDQPSDVLTTLAIADLRSPPGPELRPRAGRAVLRPAPGAGRLVARARSGDPVAHRRGLSLAARDRHAVRGAVPLATSGQVAARSQDPAAALRLLPGPGPRRGRAGGPWPGARRGRLHRSGRVRRLEQDIRPGVGRPGPGRPRRCAARDPRQPRRARWRRRVPGHRGADRAGRAGRPDGGLRA